MIFYIYDEKTKEYTGTQNAFIDPLETKKQGKDVYLVPANSTNIKPTLEPSTDNNMLVFNGEGWELKPRFELNGIYNTIDNRIYEFCEKNGYHLEQVENGFKICAPKEKTFEEVKSDKLSELTAITSKYDNQLVNNEMIIKSSLGFTINADLRSQNNLRGLIALGIEPVNFMTADNSVKSLTLEQLNILLNECAQNGQHLYLLKWQYREQIEQAQTVEELNTIEFNFTMHDFSKDEVIADE